jgi:hypothetical protein
MEKRRARIFLRSWRRFSQANKRSCADAAGGQAAGVPDKFPHFVRIDREDRRTAARHFVIHTHDPKFTLELAPDAEAADRVGRGIIRRVCVPNSWAGDYAKYGKLLAAAQDFFAESGETNPRRS